MPLRTVRPFLLLCLLVASAAVAEAQAFVRSATLAAGGGLKAPADVAVIVPDGRVVVADRGNHQIRILDAAGTTLLKIGSGKPGLRDGVATDAQFKEPESVAVDHVAQVIYVSDSGNDAIRRVSFNGIVTTLAATSLKQPAGLALDTAGSVYVADRGNHQIKRITATGTVTTVAGTGAPGSSDGAALQSAFQHPEAVAIDAAGTLYVADTQNNVIRRIANGVVSTVTPGDFHAPASVRVDAGGTLYVADTLNHLLRTSSAGVVSTIAGTGVPGYFESGLPLQAQLHAPRGLALEGALFVADTGNDVLRVFYRAPVVTGVAPSAGNPAGGEELSVFGSSFVPGATTAAIDGIAVALTYVSSTELRVTTPAHSEGFVDITVTTPGGTATLDGAFRYVPPFVALRAVPSSLSLSPGESHAVAVEGILSGGAVTDVTARVVWTNSDPGIATIDSAAAVVSALAAGQTTLTATLETLAIDLIVRVIAGEPLPPDPATIAPPNDPTVPTSFGASMRFLYTGINPVQRDVAPDAIEEYRASVLRGVVLTRDGDPLPGVRVTVHGAAPLGYTLSRGDGRYDIVVNGGGTVTLSFTKEGFLPARRQTNVSWNRFAPIDDVALVPLDATVTHVDANAPVAQSARGSEVSDADGTRTPTIVFPSQTAATMRFADGSEQPLSALSVRMTEYTVGPNGPKAMPAPLPPQSGYTYCVELSVDEAIAAGAKSVEFSKPVSLYVDNFLGMPVGDGIPVGYYDYDEHHWVPQLNGHVLKVLDVAGGIASIDGDGDGAPDSDDALSGNFDLFLEERAKMAELFSPGQTLWRITLKHFSTVDANWPFTAAAPESARPPGEPPPTGDQQPDKSGCAKGSIIRCESQALGESISVAGTPYALNYHSARVPGRTASRRIEVSLSSATLPPDLRGIELTVDVAGQQFKQSYAPVANLKQDFEWNGRDAYGREMKGTVAASIAVRYEYPTVYRRVSLSNFDFSSAQPGSAPLRASRIPGTLVQEHLAHFHSWDSRGVGLGGWTLDAHHTFDVPGNGLMLGDGSKRTSESAAGVVNTVVGSVYQFNAPACTWADGMLGTQAKFRRIDSFTVAPDGTVYFVPAFCQVVLRLDIDGRIYRVAGPGTQHSGDGGPALQASIPNPNVLAYGRDGLYVAESATAQFPLGAVRRISPDGIINTVHSAAAGGRMGLDGSMYQVGRIITRFPDGTVIAGGGTTPWSPATTGVPATSVEFLNPAPSAVTADAAGSVYIVLGNRIVRVTPDGMLRQFANLCDTACNSGGTPGDITMSPDGKMYVSNAIGGRFRLYEIAPDGAVRIVVDARNGQPPLDSQGNFTDLFFGGDGGPASDATFSNTIQIQVAGDGTLYLLERSNRRIRKITASLAKQRGAETIVPSEDGSVVYVFDAEGRHVRTSDARLGTTLLRFGYDAEGQLATITDLDGRVTTIERAGGQPVAIVAPGGQRTTIATDANGFLSEVTNPTAEKLTFTYTADGLLTGMHDAKEQPYTFTYDDEGRLELDEDPAQGGKELTLSQPNGNLFSVAVATLMGRTTTYLSERLASGDTRRTRTDSAGLTTIELREESTATTVTAPDGTIATVTPRPDPRFGMQAPIGTFTIKTPSGLTFTATTTRTVVLSTPGDALALQSETTTTAVNGKNFRTIVDVPARTVVVQTPLGRTITQFLDSAGRATRIEVPSVTPVQATYDALGRLRTVSHGTRTATFDYDAQDRLQTVTDALQRTVRFEYDDGDRVMKQILPGGREIGFSYDANGNLTSVTPPGRRPHAFTFTPVNLAGSYKPPLTASTLYEYNADQQLTKVTRADDTTIDLTYDSAGRLATIGSARESMTLGYLAAGNVGSIATHDGQTLAYTYDGTLPKTMSWSGAVTGTIAFAYDNNFRLTTETVAGNAATFAYDDDGLLTRAGALTLARDAQNGRMTGSAIGGVTDTWTYAALGEAESYAASTSALLFRQQFTRDAAGRVAQTVDTLLGVTNTHSYEYDAAGRLWKVTRNGTLVATYEYDENGNRLSLATPSGSVAATYDAEDRMLTYGDASYTYTENGDLRTKTDVSGVTTYDYDAFGNLRSVMLPDGTNIEYVIDGQQRRVGKKVNGALTRRWLYADQLRIVAELDGSGALISRFVYGTRTNVPDYMIRNGQTLRIISDHLGTPRVIVNTADGAVVQYVHVDEFGNILHDSNLGLTPFGFAGGLYDRDTNLVRFGARDYDAVTGRWLLKDPSLFTGGANLYAYSLSDPVNYVDINGREPVTLTLLGAIAQRAAIGAAAGAVGNVVAQGVSNLIAGRSFFDCFSLKDVGISALTGAAIGVAAPSGPLASFAVGGGLNALQYAASERSPGWFGAAYSAMLGGLGAAAGKLVEENLLAALPAPALRYHEGVFFRLKDTRQLTGGQSFGIGAAEGAVTNYREGGCQCP